MWPEGHPYAAPEPSDPSTLEELRTYAAASYQPGNTSLRVEGDVAAQDVVDLLYEKFPPALLQGSGETCGRAPSKETPPPPVSTDLVHVPAPVWRPRLYVGWSLPPGHNEDDAVYVFVADLLENALWWPALHSSGVVSASDHAEFGVGCGYQPGLHGSAIVCRVDLPDRATADKTYRQVLGAVRNQWFVPSPYAADGRAITYVEAFDGEGLGEDDLVDRGLSTWLDRVDPALTVAEAMSRVDAATVRDLLGRWITPDRTVGVALDPSSASPPTVPTPGGPKATLDERSPPAWHLTGPTVTTRVERLANGLQVWSVPDRSPVVARTALISRGGWATSPLTGADEVLGAVEWKYIRVDPNQIHEESGLNWRQDAGPTAHVLETFGPASRLDLALWLLRVAGSDVRADFSSRQAQLDAEVEAAFGWIRDRPDAIGSALRLQALLPGDRVGTAWWERLRAARSVGEGAVLRWQRAVRHPAGSVLVVQGPVAPEVVSGLGAKYLGGWKGKGDPADPQLSPLPPAGARKVMVLAEPRSLSSVTVTCRVPGRTDDNAAEHAVLAALLDQAMFRSVRDLGGNYVAETETLFLDPRVGLLVLTASVWPSQAGDALAAMLGVLELAGGDVPEATLARARLEATGRRIREVGTEGSLFRVLTETAVEGRTVDRVPWLAAEMAEVEPAAVTALLRDCVGHEAATVIGPDDGGLPGAERVDWAAIGEALTKSLR